METTELIEKLSYILQERVVLHASTPVDERARYLGNTNLVAVEILDSLSLSGKVTLLFTNRAKDAVTITACIFAALEALIPSWVTCYDWVLKTCKKKRISGRVKVKNKYLVTLKQTSAEHLLFSVELLSND